MTKVTDHMPDEVYALSDLGAKMEILVYTLGPRSVHGSLCVTVFVFLLFCTACTSTERPASEPVGPNRASPAVRAAVTTEDGRREVYELWKASEQISPLLPGSKSRLDPTSRKAVTEALKGESFLRYENRDRRNFREFRDGLVSCSESNDAACSVENMGRFFAVLADWQLDEAASESFGDQEFTRRVVAVEEFAKGISLVNVNGKGSRKLPDPKPCALAYAELYKLGERLSNTKEAIDTATFQGQAMYTMTHAVRAGIMGVSTRECLDAKRRSELDQLRTKLSSIAADYGKGNWDQRSKGGLTAIIWTGGQLALQPAEYEGTAYGELSEVTKQLHQLFK